MPCPVPPSDYRPTPKERAILTQAREAPQAGQCIRATDNDDLALARELLTRGLLQRLVEFEFQGELHLGITGAGLATLDCALAGGRPLEGIVVKGHKLQRVVTLRPGGDVLRDVSP